MGFLKPRMNINKEKIQSIINVFETGSPEGNYGAVSIFNDGPRNVKQISYGRSMTTASGHLQTLLQNYINNGGKYASELRPFVGQIRSNLSLWRNKALIEILKKSGDDPIMRRTQDEFFDEKYWGPAHEWFSKNGFTKNLSMLVIYDSFIHSGSILGFLRKRFAASPPANGGIEADWISQYLNTRHNWLAAHSRPILRKTIYRTRDMLRVLNDGDWDLNKPFSANGVIVH